MEKSKTKIGQAPQETQGMDSMINHEGRLGYIEGKMESFATKEDIQSIKTEFAKLKPDIELAVQNTITSQTKWIAACILVPVVLAVIGWLLWGIEHFGN